MRKTTLFVIFIFTSVCYIYPQLNKISNTKKENSKLISKIDTNKSTLLIEFKDLNRIEGCLKQPEQNFFMKYSTILISLSTFLAILIQSCLMYLINMKIIKSGNENQEKQIESAKNHLEIQMSETLAIELKKIKSEAHYKKISEFKYKVAQFIDNASHLNNILIEIKKKYDGKTENIEISWLEYNKTQQLREDILTNYYLIMLILDDSEEYKILKETINNYIDLTCMRGKFRIDKINLASLSEYISQIYNQTHKIANSNSTI